MITGELTLVNSEFQIDIQDLNFLPMSMANIESTTTTSNSTSLYSWSKTTSLGRLSAQSMANTASSNNSTPNSSNPNTQTPILMIQKILMMSIIRLMKKLMMRAQLS